MIFLSRIPVWGWYLFSVAFCYWLWNPYFSFIQMLTSDTDAAVKALVSVVTLIILSLYIIEGHKSLNVFAIILFFALFGCILWLAVKMGVHTTGTIQWWGQWIAGLLLTIAFQGSRVYRSMTGRVAVNGSVEHDSDMHHH